MAARHEGTGRTLKPFAQTAQLQRHHVRRDGRGRHSGAPSAGVLVDELAHTNIEGSKHTSATRCLRTPRQQNRCSLHYERAHLESVTPLVHKITGIVVRETVPDWVLKRVDEIVLSDVTPEALAKRMRRGDVYPLERWTAHWVAFFRPST